MVEYSDDYCHDLMNKMWWILINVSILGLLTGYEPVLTGSHGRYNKFDRLRVCRFTHCYPGSYVNSTELCWELKS